MHGQQLQSKRTTQKTELKNKNKVFVDFFSLPLSAADLQAGLEEHFGSRDTLTITQLDIRAR